MSNPLRGEVELQAGDVAYRLAFDVNAFCSAQQALGKKTMEIVADFSDDADDLVTARGLLWAGLQKNHACHLLQAGEIMSDAGQVAVRAVISEGLAAAFGLSEKTEDKDSQNPPMPIHGIGERSTEPTVKLAGKAKSSGPKPRA